MMVVLLVVCLLQVAQPFRTSLSLLNLRRRGVALSSSSSSSSYVIDDIRVPGPLKPLTNYLLVKKDAGRDTTSGGLVLAKAEKPQQGTVVAVGPGREHKETGALMPVAAAVGDRVLWGRYDGAGLKYQKEEHTLLRDSDLALIWDGSSRDPSLDANLRVRPGFLLLKVMRKAGTTSSGIFLSAPGFDDDIPLEGKVVKIGGGALAKDGKTTLPLGVDIGDCVRFRDFDTTDVSINGEDFVIINANCAICKWTPLEEEENA